MDRQQEFARLSALLARFEPGDLVSLSELMDKLLHLQGSYQGNQACLDFISQTHAWIQSKLNQHQDIPDFADRLGAACELLQSWTPTLKPNRKREIEDRMRDFFQGTTLPTATAPGQAEGVAQGTRTDIFASQEIFAVFLIEARERLSQAQELVLQLETNPRDADTLAALFRVFHTIKGESGFLHLPLLGELTHRLENLLDLLRNAKLELDRRLVDVLLAGIDHSSAMISLLEAGSRTLEESTELSAFLEQLDTISTSAQPSLGAVLVQSGKLPAKLVESILAKQKASLFQERFGDIAVKENLISAADLHEALQVQAQAAQAPGGGETDHPAIPAADAQLDEIIKVRLGKVNYLVDMIGELTIALGQVKEDSLAMSQVKKITRGLQFGAMELRTDTMQSLFSTSRRIIRDLSHDLDKPVTVKTEGERLEIDRNLIKKLEEPMMHLVRNALDHGLEPKGERIYRGKPEAGTVTIQAIRHGSTIGITVADDGRGLDRQLIIAKAIERGLVSAEVASSLSDSQVHDFIFNPGFSTSESVSKISGRGVGMDIVRSMVLASRGSLRIRSETGKGTAFIMTFPISTAIIDGLLIRVGGTTLIVPVSSVVESLKIPVASLSRVNNNAELVTIRDKVMPVLRLESVLGMQFKLRQDRELGITAADQSGPAHAPAKNLIGLIVENADHQTYFLVIDEVIAKKEVVVKPLGPKFRTMRGITSGTVLAGGAIGLVLDIDQVVSLDLRANEHEKRD